MVAYNNKGYTYNGITVSWRREEGDNLSYYTASFYVVWYLKVCLPWEDLHTSSHVCKWLPLPCSAYYNYYTDIPVAVEELQYFVRMFKATRCPPIRQSASAIAFHEGCLAFRSQRSNISYLQRSLSPRWSFSIWISMCRSNSNFTPSENQITTESTAFESSFRVGVTAVEEMTRSSHKSLSTDFARIYKCGPLLWVYR